MSRKKSLWGGSPTCPVRMQGIAGGQVGDLPHKCRKTVALLGFVCLCLNAGNTSFEAAIAESSPPYRPEQSVTGTIRLWGHGNVKIPWLKQLVAFWEEGFKQYHPNVSIQYELRGTSSAIPALFTGMGDLAILGEEIDPAAVAAFKHVKHYPPLGIDIMTGSLDVRNFDYAQMFFVHKDNPVSELTLSQLDAIFGEEHR